MAMEFHTDNVPKYVVTMFTDGEVFPRKFSRIRFKKVTRTLQHKKNAPVTVPSFEELQKILKNKNSPFHEKWAYIMECMQKSFE